MKTLVAITAYALLTGCATIGPADFANRCTIEGFGPGSPHHEECTHYYARSYAIQRQYAMGRALSAGGKALLEQDQDDDKTIQCSTFGNQMTCSEF